MRSVRPLTRGVGLAGTDCARRQHARASPTKSTSDFRPPNRGRQATPFLRRTPWLVQNIFLFGARIFKGTDDVFLPLLAGMSSHQGLLN